MGDYRVYLEPKTWKALGISTMNSLCKTEMESSSSKKDEEDRIDNLKIYSKSQRYDTLRFVNSNEEQLPYEYLASTVRTSDFAPPPSIRNAVSPEKPKLPPGVKLIAYEPDYKETIVWVEKLTNVKTGYYYKYREPPLKIWKYTKKTVRERLSVPNISFTVGSTSVKTDRPWTGTIKVLYYYSREKIIKEALKENSVVITVFKVYMSPIGYDAESAEIEAYLLPLEIAGQPWDELDCLLCNPIVEGSRRELSVEDSGGMVELINNARITHPPSPEEELPLLCEDLNLSTMAHELLLRHLDQVVERPFYNFKNYVPEDFFFPGSDSSFYPGSPELYTYGRQLPHGYYWDGIPFSHSFRNYTISAAVNRIQLAVGEHAASDRMDIFDRYAFFRQYYSGSIYYEPRNEYKISWLPHKINKSIYLMCYCWFFPWEDIGIDKVREQLLAAIMSGIATTVGDHIYILDPTAYNSAGSHILEFSRSVGVGQGYHFNPGRFALDFTFRNEVYSKFKAANGDLSQYEHMNKDQDDLTHIKFYMVGIILYDNPSIIDNDCPPPANSPIDPNFTCSPDCLNKPCEWYQKISKVPTSESSYYYLSPDIVMPCYVPWICALKRVILFTELGGTKCWTEPQFGLNRGFGDVDHENPYIDLKDVNYTVSWQMNSLEPFIYPGEYFYFMFEVSFDSDAPCQFLYGPSGYFETHCLTSGTILGCGYENGLYGGEGFSRDDELFWSYSPDFRWLVYYKSYKYWLRPSDFSKYDIGDRVFIFKQGSTMIGDKYIPCKTGQSFTDWNLARGIQLTFQSVTYRLDSSTDFIIPLSLGMEMM